MPLSDMQTAIGLLINSFSKYAGKEGDQHTLTKGELKELLQKELGEMMGKASDKAELDSIFDILDQNKDGTVDFKEFTAMASCIAMKCHEYFTKK